MNAAAAAAYLQNVSLVYPLQLRRTYVIVKYAHYVASWHIFVSAVEDAC